ncbi:hypothetical protein J6590_066908 [Homalodisca vitripennis]|nr:hypothetical protein J6590_066908 [Homalodisca vitripennis]
MKDCQREFSLAGLVMGENLARSCNISSADNTGSQIKSESKTFLQNHQDGSILRSKLTQIEPPTKRLRYKKIKPKVAGGKVSTFHNVDSVGPTVLAQVVSKNLGAPFGHTEQQLVSGVQVPTLRNINSSIMPTVLAQVAPTNVAGMALNFCVPVNNQLILIGPNMCVNGINAGHSQSNISYLPQALTQSTSKDNKNLNIKFDTLKSQQNTVDQFNKKPTEKSLLSSNNDVEHIISESSHLSDNSISKNATTSYCKVDSEKKETATSVSLCRVCNVECGNIELLHKHLEREDLICRVCTAEFCDHKELETHFFSHKPYKCTVCQEVFFDKTSLFAHRKGSGSCSYLKQQCKMCNKQFSSQRSLNKHSLLYHVKRNKKYKCVVCTKKFNTPGLLSRHEQSCHTVYEVVECNICQKLLDGPERLKIHVKAWHLDCDEDCGSACPICGKIFHSKNLKQHLETHDSESLCEVCGKSVKGKSTMRKHMQRMHPKSGKFLCKHCNDEFDNELTFLQHKKKVHSSHSNPLPVYCEICGKVYKSATMLKMHKAIHSNEKPFKCETCGASFKQKVTLNTHRRVHSSVGKYSCDNCGKTFKWKQTFDKHVEKCVDDLNDD